MATLQRDGSARGQPDVLIYAAAQTCGLLAALAVQIWLAHAGFDLSALWRDLFSAQGLNLRTAGPWWAMAGAAFIAGGATAAALSRLPPPWHRLRALRWTLATAAIFLLAAVGHWAGELQGAAPGTQVAARLTALAVAAVLATCGAYFTARR